MVEHLPLETMISFSHSKQLPFFFFIHQLRLFLYAIDATSVVPFAEAVKKAFISIKFCLLRMLRLKKSSSFIFVAQNVSVAIYAYLMGEKQQTAECVFFQYCAEKTKSTKLEEKF